MKILNSGPTTGAGGLRSVARASSSKPVSGISAAVQLAPVDTIDAVARVATAIPPEELTEKVRETIRALIGEVDSLRREVEQKNARILELERLADTDPMLPVANRRAFVRELERAMSYTERYNVPASLLFFDMDGLKQINDNHGHTVGDMALLHMAEVLSRNVRASDLIARLGGDELAIILTHADETHARVKAEMLAACLQDAPLMLDGEALHISASVGVYTFKPGETPEELLRKADAAMYRQKVGSRL